MNKPNDRIEWYSTEYAGKLGRVDRTGRGFEIILFNDRYNTPCSLQQSSLADFTTPGSSAIWLGIDRQSDKQHNGMFDLANKTRMHLDLEQVKSLMACLQLWIETGRFSK